MVHKYRHVPLLLALLAWSAFAMGQTRLAIRGGTLIDVRDGSLMPDALVVLEGDRIVSVSRAGSVPAGAKVIDAPGKFILPGLIDLHVHYEDWSPELYLNHGVTTVVDLGNVHDWILAQREGIRKGVIPGPRLFLSTDRLSGVAADSRAFRRSSQESLESTAQLPALMRKYIAEKVDAVKTYEDLTKQLLSAITEMAATANLPVLGHFQDVRVAAAVGANGIEHTTSIANAILDVQAQSEAKKKMRKGLVLPPECFMDLQKLPGIVQLMVQKHLYLNPTFRMTWQGDRAMREKGFPYEDFDLLINNWRLRYLPLSFRLADLKEYQQVGLWHWADLTPYELDLFHRGYTNAQLIVKMFSDAGGKLYAGTDSAHLSVPGLSLHQEMELITDAGVSPLKALQAATINPAELMRFKDQLGTIEEGKEADVLILNANPLENIRNSRKIATVISRGRVLDGQYHADFENPLPRSEPQSSSHFFPSPRILSVSPDAVEEGHEGASVSVTGSGFIPYSFIRIDGKKIKTEFIDEFTLKAALPMERLKLGTYHITIENPDFGWGSTYANGASDLVHLGIRDHISNEFLLLVTARGTFPTARPEGR